jgi:hypothetical protein
MIIRIAREDVTGIIRDGRFRPAGVIVSALSYGITGEVFYAR